MDNGCFLEFNNQVYAIQNWYLRKDKFDVVILDPLDTQELRTHSKLSKQGLSEVQIYSAIFPKESTEQKEKSLNNLELIRGLPRWMRWGTLSAIATFPAILSPVLALMFYFIATEFPYQTVAILIFEFALGAYLGLNTKKLRLAVFGWIVANIFVFILLIVLFLFEV